MVTSTNDARSWAGLEPAPSTRESTHLLTKCYPINTTLSSAGTAEDLFTVTPVPATVNIITNPSFETGNPPTGFTASDATLAQDATYYKYGVKSLKITPDNSAAGEGAYISLGSIGAGLQTKVPIAVSCYFRRVTSSGSTARVSVVASSTTPFTSSNTINGNTVTLSTAWQRSSLSLQLDTTDTYTVYLATATQHSTVFYADGFQVENRDGITDYCDGTQNFYCSWDGTAHASVSRRVKSISSIRNLTLYTDKDIYIAYDGTATTSGRKVLAGTTWWVDHPIHLTKNISFINSVTGETPTVTGEIWGT